VVQIGRWRRLDGLWSRGPVPVGVWIVITVVQWFLAIGDPRWWRILIAALWTALSGAQVIGRIAFRRHLKLLEQSTNDSPDAADPVK
jgi:hypothetical protein